jgi:hypothetical protein
VRAFDIRVLLLRVVAFAVENEVLDGLRFAQCHGEDAKDEYEDGPNNWCAHVEPNQVDIGEYRLKQDNKVCLRSLTAGFSLSHDDAEVKPILWRDTAR